jgi:5-methylcytosine-specific restriction endonuclease McrA
MSDFLLLNTTGEPVSLLPMSTLTWQDAIKYLVLDKATVLAWHDDWIVRSARWETPVPAVLMLRDYMKPKVSVRFTKSNVFLRDLWHCQYCGIEVNRKTATLDHVLPVSHGGKTTYENCVTACGTCNGKKGNNKKIKPKKAPHRPGYYELVERRKQLPFDLKHPEWAVYIGI